MRAPETPMYQFRREPQIPLLTVIRSGFWTLKTVVSYESDLRSELRLLGADTRPTSCIVDIRGTGIQEKAVANALRDVVARLGPLDASKTAIVTSTGIAKLQATRVANPNSRVFTSMILARDWIMGKEASKPLRVRGATSVGC